MYVQQLKWPHRNSEVDAEDAFLEADLHILLFQSDGLRKDSEMEDVCTPGKMII